MRNPSTMQRLKLHTSYLSCFDGKFYYFVNLSGDRYYSTAALFYTKQAVHLHASTLAEQQLCCKRDREGKEASDTAGLELELELG